MLECCLNDVVIGRLPYSSQFNHRDVKNRLVEAPNPSADTDLIFKAVKLMEKKNALPPDPYLTLLSDLDFAFQDSMSVS